MGYARAIATNTAWLLIGKFFVVIVSLVMTAALARSLGVFHYGEFTAAFAYLSIFGVVADFGFFQILVREVARRPDEEAAITNNIFTLRTLFGFVIYALAAWTVWLIPYTVYGDTIKFGVLILAIASFFLSVNTTLIGIFQVHQEMYKAVIGDVVSRLLLLGLLLWALASGQSLAFIFGLYAVANLANLLVTYSFLRQRLRLQLAWDKKLWRTLFIEAWPLGLVTILGIIYFKIDSVILSILKSPADVGIYGAPYKVFEFLTIVPALFMGTVFPVITQLITIDRDRLRRVVQAAYDVLMVLAIGMAIGLVILAKGIVGLVAGQEFVTASTLVLAGHQVTAVQVIMLLGLTIVSVYIGNLWGPVVVAFGRQSELIRPGVIAVLINIVLNLLLIPRGSYLAAALVTFITESYIALTWSRIARRELPITLSHQRLVRIILAGTIMGLVIWPIRHVSVVVPTIVGGVVYLTVIFALGIIPKEFLRQIVKPGQVG